MNILTISASPYLLVRNGKINADIIKSLVNSGHQVSSAVWHHDESYFMPCTEGIHEYEENGKSICRLYPFTPKTDEASPVVYELMKTVHPEIVITIGDHKDTNFVSAIKSMYPNLFKWIAIYTTDCVGISKINKDAFEYADHVVTTTKFGFEQISSFANINGEFFPYGSSDEFYCEDKDRSGVLFSAAKFTKQQYSSFCHGHCILGL
jgi:hypothetical protein